MTSLTSSEQGNGGPHSDDGSSIRTMHLKNHASNRDYDTKSLIPDRGRIRRLSDSETVYGNWTGEVWPDQCSSTRSLWTRDLDYREINGRRYCRNYHMPNDETEQLRLTIQHQVIMHAFEDELTLAPIDNPTHVLDLGTGTGEWAIRFAELHPYCEVVGTDISAIQETRRVPTNVFFEVEDAEEWDRPTEHYDLVHVRGLEGAFRDWHAVYKNIYNSLKPGGWVQVADMGGKEGSYSFFSGFPPEAPIFRIMKHLFDAAEKDGRPRGMYHLNPEYLAKAGFVDIHVTDKTLPMAIDEDSIGKLWLMAWLDGLEAYALRTLTEVVGWDPDVAMRDLRQTARELARRARNEDYCKTMTLTMRVVLARKPLAPVTVPWSNSSIETSPALATLRSVSMGQHSQQ